MPRKREIFGWYREELGDLQLNSEAPGVKNTYWMVTAVLDAALGISKVDLMAAMSRRDVDCRPFFHPLSSLPAYADLPHTAACATENAVSYSVAPRAVNLPSGFDLDEERVALVCRRLREAIAELSG